MIRLLPAEAPDRADDPGVRRDAGRALARGRRRLEADAVRDHAELRGRRAFLVADEAAHRVGVADDALGACVREARGEELGAAGIAVEAALAGDADRRAGEARGEHAEDVPLVEVAVDDLDALGAEPTRRADEPGERARPREARPDA